MAVGCETPGDGDSPEAVCRRCARKRGVAFIDLARVVVDPEAFARVPVVLQDEYGVLPVKLDGGTLYVAVGELSGRTRERLESFTGLRVVQALAVAGEIPIARRAAQKAIGG